MSCYPSVFIMFHSRDVQFVHGDINERRFDSRCLLRVGPFVGFHRERVTERKLDFAKECRDKSCETVETYGFLCSSARDDLCLTPVASGVDIVWDIVVAV